MQSGTPHGPIFALGLIALLPALCEEALFRGFILTGLRRDSGPTWTVATLRTKIGTPRRSAITTDSMSRGDWIQHSEQNLAHAAVPPEVALTAGDVREFGGIH